MPRIRSIRNRWAPALSLLLGILLVLPTGRHGSPSLVLCVESEGTVNVEHSRGDECSSSSSSTNGDAPIQSALMQSSGEHCPGCTDLPLALADATEPCESAVLSAPTVGDAAAAHLATNEQDLQTSDFRIARLHRRPLRPRAPETAPQSFRRELGHLFSDTSVDRAKSSVELLI